MKFVFIFLACIVIGGDAQDVVKLPNGYIKGQVVKSFTNKSYLAFEGIPFAKPPVGKLRFQAPEPADNWDGVLETTELKHCCYSEVYDFDEENEDCLHLNVFTPLLNAAKNFTKLPVIFWIYGGGFVNGCANWWPQYWMDEDIVVLIPNYRVGPFGFLATGDLSAPGNAGLKDQNLALKWAYENVHLFGGDNQRITIAGQSAGGSSVGWQLLSQKSKGYFRGAIIESGSPLNTWAYRSQPYEYAINLARTIDQYLSTNTSTGNLIEFLQNVDSKTIDIASAKTSVKEPLPVIEPDHPGALITNSMYESFSSGDYNKVPMIVGANSEEKITMATDVESVLTYGLNLDQNLNVMVPKNFNYKPNVTALQIGQKVREAYVGNSTFAENLGKVVRFCSDNQYTRSVIKQGKLMAQHNDVYFYIFSYDGVEGGNNITFPDADSVAHAEELVYNWGTKSLDQLNDSDRLTHYRMMKLWTNFVKHLNPTPYPDPLLQNVTWEKVLKDQYNFLNINDTLSMEVNPKGKFFIGWEQVFEEFGQRPFVTF